ncbi:MAG: ABC transporter ATP-binding protein [Agathobacter sp.]|nr:ABC transporter ATP-binding protein [Agathobacter sp.]
MIKLDKIRKLIGTFYLRDITLEIPEGYIIGLVGANGCGKTSFLHVLMGLYKQDSGEMELMGMQYPKDEAKLHDQIGVVLQERLYEDYMTLQENAAYYGRFYSNYDEAYLLELLKKYDLDPKRKYKGLSKGEELKFQFAAALAHHPRLLLLDEPTGNFDPEFRDEFLKALKEFIADGEHTIILATHLTDDLDKMADYLIYMEEGSVLTAMDIEELRSKYRIIAGEDYRMKLLPEQRIIHIEKGEFATRALIRHRQIDEYDASYTVSVPTIEEFMYFVTKRENRNIEL